MSFKKVESFKIIRTTYVIEDIYSDLTTAKSLMKDLARVPEKALLKWTEYAENGIGCSYTNLHFELEEQELPVPDSLGDWKSVAAMEDKEHWKAVECTIDHDSLNGGNCPECYYEGPDN